MSLLNVYANLKKHFVSKIKSHYYFSNLSLNGLNPFIKGLVRCFFVSVALTHHDVRVSILRDHVLNI